jgi:hypothetical protein
VDDKYFRLLLLAISLSSCSIPFYTNVKSNLESNVVVPVDSIAVQYVQYSNEAIVNISTKILFETLAECSNLKLISPDSLEEKLYRSKFQIPQHLTKSGMQDLYAKINIQYLLVSQLEQWEDIQRDKYSAVTTITLLLYDLQQQRLIWSSTGSKDPAVSDNSFRFAAQTEQEFKGLIKHLMKQWTGFCIVEDK